MGTDGSQRAEWDLLLCSGLPRGEEARKKFEEAAVHVTDPWLLLRLAERSRLLVWLAVELSAVEPPTDDLRFLRGHLAPVARLMRRQTEVISAVAARVVGILEEGGIPVAVTKGCALQHLVYTDGSRTFKDCDFMIRPEDATAAATLLSTGGAVQGYYKVGSNTASPLDLQTRLIYARSPDHLPKMVVSTGDDLVAAVNVDVAYSFTWASSAWQIDHSPALLSRTSIPAGDGSLPCLPNPYHFLFVCLHLFREAWHEMTMRKVYLAQLRDVACFAAVLSEDERRTVTTLASSFGLEYPFTWVLAHCDEVFDGELLQVFDMPRADASELNTVMLRGDRMGRWRGTMTDRLTTGDIAIESS